MSRRGCDKCNNQEGLNFPCRECHFLMICNLHLFTQSTEKELAGCGMGVERERESVIHCWLCTLVIICLLGDGEAAASRTTFTKPIIIHFFSQVGFLAIMEVFLLFLLVLGLIFCFCLFTLAIYHVEYRSLMVSNSVAWCKQMFIELKECWNIILL